jgi:hypothetical protein
MNKETGSLIDVKGTEIENPLAKAKDLIFKVLHPFDDVFHLPAQGLQGGLDYVQNKPALCQDRAYFDVG